MIDEQLKLIQASPAEGEWTGAVEGLFSILRILMVTVAGGFLGWIIGMVTGFSTGLISFIC